MLDNENLKETREQFGAVMGTNSTRNTSGKGVSAKSLELSPVQTAKVADSSSVDYKSIPALTAEIEHTREAMLAAAKALDFMEAARLRDYMLALEERVKKLK